MGVTPRGRPSIVTGAPGGTLSMVTAPSVAVTMAPDGLDAAGVDEAGAGAGDGVVTGGVDVEPLPAAATGAGGGAATFEL